MAGHRGGDEPTFRLSKPRYNRDRRTVSYRAKPLRSGRLPGGAAQAAGFRGARKFGAASLSIVGAPQGVASCQSTLMNRTGDDLTAKGVVVDLYDNWITRVDTGTVVKDGDNITWQTQDRLGSCGTTVTWQVGATGSMIAVSTNVTSNGFRNTCTSNNAQFRCRNQVNESGQAEWMAVPASS